MRHAAWVRTIMVQRAASGQPPPRTLLAISGGVDKGSFSAGLLNAWTRRGDRPSFDVVTGVSTGALVAPFAFLGADEDDELKLIYTNLGRKDVYRQRILSGLFGGSSLLDTAPLKALIARYVTASFVDRVAAEHAKGRRLLVMTTNLDAQRGVIWDMGAIAGSAPERRVELFRDVLLASASIPGAFPPVLIDVTGSGRRFSEMHVDGGTIGGFFVLPRTTLLLNDDGPSSPRTAIYLLYNGRLAPEFTVVKPRIMSILTRSLLTALTEADRTMVEELRIFARGNRAAFSVCAFESEDSGDTAPLFDTDHMRELYASGEAQGSNASGCLTTAFK